MKTTVQRAYLMDGTKTQRALVDSEGRITTDGDWGTPSGGVVVVPGETYERWVDVPASWLGVSVWWR